MVEDEEVTLDIHDSVMNADELLIIDETEE